MLLLASLFPLLFLGGIGLHLFELYLFVEAELFEEVGEDVLVSDDGLSVILIETDPDLEAVAGGIIDLGRDEAEPVNFVTAIEVFSQEEEGELLIDFFLVGLRLRDLEDKPTSILVALIFPLGLDPRAEVFDGVDSFLGGADLVAASKEEYAFCLLF